MIQQSQQQKQLLKFSPLQIQMLNLLHLTTHELEQKIKDEIEENPALEIKESVEDDFSETDTDEEYSNEEEFADFYPEYDDDVPNYKEKSDLDYYAADQQFDMPVVQHDTFHDRVKRQIDLMPLEPNLATKIHYLIDSLDEDGYLRADMEELSYQYSFMNGEMCETEELLHALKYIQDCDPAGIGARNLQECLLLQLDKTKQHEPNYKIARQILCNHIFELENRNFDKIMRSLNIDPACMKAAIQLIGKLSPKPNIYQDNILNTNQVVPEYSVRNEDGKLIVALINKNLPELKLNETVVDMVDEASENKQPMKRRDKAAVTFFKNKLHSAKWFIEAIKQREESMLRVMKAIVRFQYEFFQTGDYKNLKPMILKNISELVGLDISTISRVTSTKYVQTDFGTILLKELFTEAMSKENGDVVSNKEIQDIIKDMLDNENKEEPLTDQEISDVLKERGYTVARRTVAKYRECIGIPIAKMRRCLV